MYIGHTNMTGTHLSVVGIWMYPPYSNVSWYIQTYLGVYGCIFVYKRVLAYTNVSGNIQTYIRIQTCLGVYERIRGYTNIYRGAAPVELYTTQYSVFLHQRETQQLTTMEVSTSAESCVSGFPGSNLLLECLGLVGSGQERMEW
jgi:hypothetical protein